jgi:hypothetical protein
MAPEPSAWGERLRPPNQSVMNSRFPKQMLSPREKPSHDKHSLPAVVMNANDGTIGTSGGKSTLQIPLPSVSTISVFCTGKI